MDPNLLIFLFWYLVFFAFIRLCLSIDKVVMDYSYKFHIKTAEEKYKNINKSTTRQGNCTRNTWRDR